MQTTGTQTEMIQALVTYVKDVVAMRKALNELLATGPRYRALCERFVSKDDGEPTQADAELEVTALFTKLGVTAEEVKRHTGATVAGLARQMGAKPKPLSAEDFAFARKLGVKDADLIRCNRQ